MNAQLKELSAWLGCGLIAATGVGAVAAMIHLSGYAPLGLVSLGAGLGLGFILVQLAKRLQVKVKKFVIPLTIVVACYAIVSQHAFIYGDFRRQWHDSLRSPQVGLFRSDTPPSPIEFFAREATPLHIALWFVDAAIIIASATGFFWLAYRPHSPVPTP